jgi:surfeit locus 1 family protein
MQPGSEPPNRPPLPSATTDLGLGSHLGYAIQWFSFAIILVVGYVALMLRGRRGVRSQESE